MSAGAHFTGLDGLVLVVYFILSMGVGVYFYVRGKSGSTEGYTAAGRSLPGIIVGLSILATYLSSISFLALPGKSYATNWNAFVFSLSLPFAAWIGVKYFLPFYRNSGEVSAYHHLEVRFGPWARLYTGVTYLVMQAVRMGAVMLLMALPLEALLGWPVWVIIVITGISVTIYSMMGGIVAVIWADAIQCVILMGGALLCAAIMLGQLPGGMGQMFEIARESDKFSLGSFGLNMTESTFWVVLIYGVFVNLTNFGIDQNYVQRYVASKTDKEARKSLWVGSLLYIPVSAVFFFIGTSLFAFYNVFPDRLPLEYKNETDRVFAWFIVSELPPGVTGLLVASIFAAAMSTVSTSLNSSATILMTDVYKRYMNPGATEKNQMAALYTGTVVWGILGTLIALALISSKQILDAWWTLQGILAGGMLGLFLLGIMSKKATSPAAIVGVIVGVAVIAWMSLTPLITSESFPAALKNPLHSNMTIIVGTVVIVAVGMLATGILFPPKNSGAGSGAHGE